MIAICTRPSSSDRTFIAEIEAWLGCPLWVLTACATEQAASGRTKATVAARMAAMGAPGRPDVGRYLSTLPKAAAQHLARKAGRRGPGLTPRQLDVLLSYAMLRGTALLGWSTDVTITPLPRPGAYLIGWPTTTGKAKGHEVWLLTPRGAFIYENGTPVRPMVYPALQERGLISSMIDRADPQATDPSPEAYAPLNPNTQARWRRWSAADTRRHFPA